MKFTGERYVPSVGGDIELEHTHRYQLAAEFVRGKDVLDIASGEGYGSAYLAQHARRVVGVDIDPVSIDHAKQNYALPNLEFLQGDCTEIPLPDASLDIVVSFETIEHHAAHDEMMQEIKRVLRKDGLLIISSPDKKEYSDIPGTSNEFHVRELYRSEFEQLLDQYFAHREIQGQRVVYGSLLAGSDEHSAPFVSYRNDDDNPKRATGTLNAMYLIAFASDEPLPRIPNSIYSTLSPGYFQDFNLLQQALEKEEALNATHTEQIGVLTTRVSDLENTTEALKGENTRLAQSEQTLEGMLGEIRQSHSWKMTSPFRVMANRLRALWRHAQ